jgi:hypothetical protein
VRFIKNVVNKTLFVVVAEVVDVVLSFLMFPFQDLIFRLVMLKHTKKAKNTILFQLKTLSAVANKKT